MARLFDQDKFRVGWWKWVGFRKEIMIETSDMSGIDGRLSGLGTELLSDPCLSINVLKRWGKERFSLSSVLVYSSSETR